MDLHPPPPLRPHGNEWERGLWWMVAVSAAIHAALIIAVFVMPRTPFLRPPAPVISYTVDLVAPDKIGGTNLIEGGKGRVHAIPMAAKQEPPPPPKVEEPKPPPEPPKPVEPPQVAKVEPPPPPKVEEKADENAFVEKTKEAIRPTPTLTEVPVAVAKLEVPTAVPTKPAPTKALPTKAPIKIAPPPPTVPPTATPLSKAALQALAKKAAEEEKARKEAEKKAAEEAALKKAVESAAKKAAAEAQKREVQQRAADERILAAVKKAESQVGEMGGGTGTKAGAPGGPISVGPGEGSGGQTYGVDYVLYLGQLERRFKDNWAWAGSDERLETVVRFSITENGDIVNLRIAHSSGDRGYDSSVERAVRSTSPLPPPPEAYRAQFGDVEYTFNAHSMQQ